MDPTAEVNRLGAALEAARDRESLLREQIGILQSTVQVLREQLEAMRADQREMRGLLASVHGVLTARYLGEPAGERAMVAPTYRARDDRGSRPGERREELAQVEPLRAVELPERDVRAEESRAGKSRPEPPRRGAQRAQPPTRTWRDALWGGEP